MSFQKITSRTAIAGVLSLVFACGTIAAIHAQDATQPADTQPAAKPAAKAKAKARPVKQTAASSQPSQAGPLIARIMPPGAAEKPLSEARDFQDSRSNMEFTVPAGWIVIEIPHLQQGEVSSMLVEGPGEPAPTCKLGVRIPKQPPKITQPMLNKIMHDDRNVTNIRGNLSQNGRQVLNITKVSQDGINGLRSQVLIPGTSQRPDVTALIDFFEAPQRTYTFECTILTADYDNMYNDIDALIRSVRFAKT